MITKELAIKGFWRIGLLNKILKLLIDFQLKKKRTTNCCENVPITINFLLTLKILCLFEKLFSPNLTKS